MDQYFGSVFLSTNTSNNNTKQRSHSHINDGIIKNQSEIHQHYTNNNNNDEFTNHNNNSSGINIGLALSGGGFRATLIGAGIVQALDGRDQPNVPRSQLAGLLQGMSHISGLSSGSWLLGTLYLNGFQSVGQLRKNDKVWRLENNLFLPNGGNNLFAQDGIYYASIASQVATKSAAGYPITITDIYGRMLMPVLVEQRDRMSNMDMNHPALSSPGSTGSAAISIEWSDIETYDYFKSHQAPYPIILAVARDPGTIGEYPNSTIFEITPHEFGSYDATLHAFSKLKYLGTPLDDNQVESSSSSPSVASSLTGIISTANNNQMKKKCVSGFDNAGFLIGTSSSVFDKIVQVGLESNNLLLRALGNIASAVLDPTNLDVAIFKPNPFRNYKNPTYQPTTDIFTKMDADSIDLTDGAMGNENVPLWPLIYKPRQLDLIFTLDASENSPKKWPTGASLTYTYARASGNVRNTEEESVTRNGDKHFYPQKHFMPKVPDENSFVNLGFTTRPTFFGCYAKDYMTKEEMNNKDFKNVPPLLVYLANTPMSYMSNMDHSKLTFKREEKDGMIQNGYDIANQNPVHGGDSNWSKCIACAIIQRERERQGQWEPTQQCQEECFDKYCWNGQQYDPTDYNVAKKHDDPKVGSR